MSDVILSVEDLKVHFPVRTGGVLFSTTTLLKAVDGMSFDIKAGETLGIVGESGCGKSTLGRAIVQLVARTHGTVTWLGRPPANAADVHALRREMQVVFQDPLASLDPRMTAGDIIAEPLRNFHGDLGSTEINRRVGEMMAMVGLSREMINRYPHEFSGGQCQRIGVARAMILRPKLVVCDEPVSALDVSVRAQVVNLLMSLQRDLGLSYLFISHDLAVVRHISHRVMVLYLGKIMELAERDALYATPRHPYTQALLAAIPIPDPDRERAKPVALLAGDPPSPLHPPSGCVFRTRCAHATAVCTAQVPALEAASERQQVACHHWRAIPVFKPV